MFFKSYSLHGKKLCAVVLATLLWSAAPSLAAPDVTSANARIESGKLVIDGTTELGNTKVRLDGKTTAGFTVTSNPTTKAFKFSVAYYPSDCVVTLQKVTGNTLGAATNWTVNNCGSGVTPRGAWLGATPYVKDDLVTFNGSTWRAKRNNLHVTPTAGADWEKFLLQGAQGPAGPQGPAGVTAKGGWLNSTSYAAGDLVFLDGSTWRAKTTNSDKQPGSNPNDWELLAQGGAQGPVGPSGLTGASGALADTVLRQGLCHTAGDYSCTGNPLFCYCGAACENDEIGVMAFAEGTLRATGASLGVFYGAFQPLDSSIPALEGKYGFALSTPSPGENDLNIDVTLICMTKPDRDHDGVANASDNCPTVFNPDQSDSNADGFGNACEPVCGNGIPEQGEQCDDGNGANGDGCSALCSTEVGYFCTGQPSVCAAVCGDGLLAGGEQCDDGNISNSDGCSSICTIE